LIVDGVRADAKGIVLQRASFRPQQLADALAASLAVRAGTKGLTADIAVAGDLPDAVIGDGVRLRAALENLIDNAVKFTDHGRVGLDITWEPVERRRGRLVFTVTDSGIGLTPSEVRRLFRPFAQANDRITQRYGGAGLGLTFVKRIAKAMKGDLMVAGRRGHGSTFRLAVTVEIPTAGRAGHGKSGAAASLAPPARTLDILCVEENPFGRVVLNTILTELGHHADFVGTGEAAIEAVAAKHYDAVLIDVSLPGMDGLEIVRRIRALPGARVILIGVSDHRRAGEEMRVQTAGMDAYLAKPLSPAAVAKLLPK
jgi:CheY-like chemotaxis protein